MRLSSRFRPFRRALCGNYCVLGCSAGLPRGYRRVFGCSARLLAVIIVFSAIPPGSRGVVVALSAVPSQPNSTGSDT